MHSIKPLMITLTAASLVLAGSAIGTQTVAAFEVPLLAADGSSKAQDRAARREQARQKREAGKRSRTESKRAKAQRGEANAKMGSEVKERSRASRASNEGRMRRNAEASQKSAADESQSTREEAKQRSRSFTDAQGRTRTRDTEVNRDTEAGTSSREVRVMGRDGAERVGTKEVSRTEDGLATSNTRTDAQGRTVTRDAVVTRDESGALNREVTVTGRDGQTITGTETITKTDDGYARSGTWTDADGNTATRDVAVSGDAESGTLVRDVAAVGRDGKKRSGQSQLNRTDDGYTRSRSRTDAEGQTSTRDAKVSIDKEAGTVTRGVAYTDREGNVRTIDDNAVRTEDGVARSTTLTGADGEQISRDTMGRWDPATQTWIKEAVVPTEDEDAE